METTELPATSSHGNQSTCDAYYLWLRVIIGACMTFIGLTGNVLTIMVMTREKIKTTTMLALTYLAIADFGVLLVYGTVSLSAIANETNNPDLAYKIKYVVLTCVIDFAYSLNVVSIYITVIVIWQRYVGVCLPTKAKTYVSLRIVNIQVICVVITAILMYIPSFCMNCFLPKMMLFNLRTPAFHAGFTIFYDLVFSLTISYVIPITSLLTMSVGLVRGLRKMKFKGDKKQKTKQEMTFSLVVIVIAFVICQSFNPVRRILRWTYPSYKMKTSCGGDLFSIFVGPLEVFFVIINSSCNFFILVVCARGFRGKLLAMIKRSSAVAPAIDGTYVTRVVEA